jgi:hypothetical protein
MRSLAAPAVHDDLELLVRAERCAEGRDEIVTAQPIARHDAEARGLICHEDILP